MKAGLLRSAVQGLVAVAASLLIVKIPALESVLTTEIQALLVGVLVPLVVALQLEVEKALPAIGKALRTPAYNNAAREVTATCLELLERSASGSENAVLRQVITDLVAELRDADGELEDLDGDGDVDEDDAALANQ